MKPILGTTSAAAAWAVLALSAGCSCSDDGSPSQPAGGSTATGGSGGGTSSSTTSSGGGATSSGGGSGGGGGAGGPSDCDPPPQAGSIYELEDALYPFETDVQSMCQYRGEVMFIVNTAAL